MTPAQKNFDYRRYLIFRLSENFKFKEIAKPVLSTVIFSKAMAKTQFEKLY